MSAKANITFNDTDMVSILKLTWKDFDRVVDTISDPRTTTWPLMHSPFPTISVVLAYLYFVLYLGPKFMENRKPFKLNNIIIVYNGAQVLLSLYMLYEHLVSGWFFDYSFKCQPVDYSYNAKALRMANLCWIYYISKLTEFADTFFFVMRKKTSQVSLLHLFHHSLTPLETWILVKFVPGGHGTFSNLLNNLVHVCMYLYYLIAAMGPEYQKYIWWKKHLTTIQLVQFFFVFVHSGQLLFNDCGYPRFLGPLLLLHSTIFFGLFLHFYYSAYTAQKAEKEIKSK